MLIADTNVLIGLFWPSPDSEVVQACRDADDDWRLPGLWVPEVRFVVLAQQLQCPLLTFARKLLELFPDVALKPGS